MKSETQSPVATPKDDSCRSAGLPVKIKVRSRCEVCQRTLVVMLRVCSSDARLCQDYGASPQLSGISLFIASFQSPETSLQIFLP